jgi:UDP-N-acetyl-D-mannosaminuronate dehydrogenase
VSPDKVVVVGQGYVGLPVAMRAVEVGYRVVGLDTDGVRVAGLQAGSSYVDDVCDETLRRALATGRYAVSGSSFSWGLVGLRTGQAVAPLPAEMTTKTRHVSRR